MMKDSKKNLENIWCGEAKEFKFEFEGLEKIKNRKSRRGGQNSLNLNFRRVEKLI